VDLIFEGGFKMSRRILCPTDLTINSKDGVAYGLSLAKKNRAQLIIFHAALFPRLSQYACCEMEPYYRWSQLLSKFKTDQLLKEAECRVRQFVCATFGAESSGVAWNPRAGLGGAAEEIVVAAIQEDVDLIVLSRRKKSALTRFFTRSIAETVSRNAPCPVLSIEAHQSTRPAPVWRVPMLGEIAEIF
jgi:nucleotide-binding universal stress UspA family protein